jgi:hypothetical protein
MPIGESFYELNVLYDQLLTRDINFSLCHQAIPVIRRMTIFQHFVEHAVGIIPTLISAFCIFIINPGINNNLALRVVTEKKAILLKELGAKPVFVFIAQRVTLPVLNPARVLRNNLEG